MSIIALGGSGCGQVACGCSPPPTVAAEDDAIRQAHDIFLKDRARGMNLSRGPCLSNGRDIPGWVVDVAHRPRNPIDDDPKNQCSAYVQGRVGHFVELDPQGRLIRTGP